MSNSLDPDQGQHIVGPDLGPNCLQRLQSERVDYQNYVVEWGEVILTQCMGLNPLLHRLFSDHDIIFYF